MTRLMMRHLGQLILPVRIGLKRRKCEKVCSCSLHVEFQKFGSSTLLSGCFNAVGLI